jgi:sulfhydrogenase subunit alpha
MHQVDLDFNIKHITKVEGAADVRVKVRGGKVEEANFAITEYKRFYTRAIEGKSLMAVPQLLSRICGTCSNAHVMAAIEACERAVGLEPTDQTMLLRRLTMGGLNIRDHALHLYLFVWPDIQGVDNFLELDEKDEEQHQILHDAFDLKAAGNMLSELVAGRSVHANFAMVGGFLKVPLEDAEKKAEMIKKLEEVRPAAIRTCERFAACDFQLDWDTEYMALLPEGEFSFIDGKIISSVKSDDPVEEEKYRSMLEHVELPYSTASGYVFKDGKPYMVGALARINLAKHMLHPKTKESIPEILEMFPSTNIYHNNLAQAVEILHAIDEAIELLQANEFKAEPMVKAEMKAGVGIGVVEAPRGMLYHKVETNEKGNVIKGEIVVPTNQNQLNVNQGLEKLIQDTLDAADKPEDIDREKLTHEMEKLVRAYDPCMSCAAHFMKIDWDIA